MGLQSVDQKSFTILQETQSIMLNNKPLAFGLSHSETIYGSAKMHTSFHKLSVPKINLKKGGTL